MEEKELFKKMRDTSTSAYKVRRTVSGAGKAVMTFIVFPLVLCAALSGGALTAFDCIAVSGGEAAVSVGFSQSRAADRSLPSVTADMCEDVRDYDEEILERLYEFDKTGVPDGYVGVVPVSLYRQTERGNVFVSDAGDKKQIDAAEYLQKPLSVKFEPSDDYRVLIIHTHGTEAFTEDGALYTKKGSYPRSDEKDKNVVCIGDIFEEIFNEAGIKTLHCEIPIDKESYTYAYSNAAKIIKDYIKKYPTIKYMFDIHRDAIELSDGSKARMVTAANGQIVSQLMFVVGSDRLVPENKNWRDNLTLAVKLQYALDEKYPGLMRPINIKQGAFNQFYTPLSILIEVGSDGNYMDEAKRSAKILAEQMVKTIKGE